MERRRERFVGLCNQAKNWLQLCASRLQSQQRLKKTSHMQLFSNSKLWLALHIYLLLFFFFFFNIDIYHLKARVGPTYLYGIWKYMDDRDNKQTCLHFLPNTKVLYIHFSFETWIELKIQGTSCAATSSQMTQMLKKKQKVPAERQKEKNSS